MLCCVLAGCGGAKSSEGATNNSDASNSTASNSTASSSSSQNSSTNSSDKSANSLAQPKQSCYFADAVKGSELISGQLKAFDKKDAKLAYSYASTSFRERNSLEQFVSIIGSQYSMLLDLKSFKVGECSQTSDGLFLFTVSLTDNSDVNYMMQYLLSNDGRWGVEGAAVYSSAG